jgi:hypothetical protein
MLAQTWMHRERVSSHIMGCSSQPQMRALFALQLQREPQIHHPFKRGPRLRGHQLTPVPRLQSCPSQHAALRVALVQVALQVALVPKTCQHSTAMQQLRSAHAIG